MNTHRHRLAGAAASCGAALALFAAPSAAQIGYESADVSEGLGVEIWTERGADHVYGDGEIASISFRPVDDAYVVVYGTDVEGEVYLLYPTEPRHHRRVRGGHIYTLDAYDLQRAGVEGLVYVQALACAYPLEPHLPAFFHGRGPRVRPHRVGHAPELVVSFGFVVGDPYLAFAHLRRAIVPVGCAPSFVGYATLSYSVGTHRYYPRYLCNDCHYDGWYDPYVDACSVFEIRVDSFWSDRHPYYERCQPRYYYWRRASVPVRYRHYKTKWSSKDRSDEMIRYFAGKSPREREHIDTRSKPSLVRDERGDGRTVRPGERGDDDRSALVRDRRERPEVSREARERKEIDRKDRDRRARDRDGAAKPSAPERRRDADTPREREKPAERPSKGKRSDGDRGRGDRSGERPERKR